MIKGQLISDIELKLSKLAISDDFQGDRRQIGFWLDTGRIAMMREEIKREGSSAITSFVSSYDCVPISKVKKDCPGGCDEYEYKVLMPVSVASLPDDIGVYRVETQSGTTIRRMKVTDISRFKHLRFGKVGKKNLCYYRIGKELVLEGGTSNFLDNGKVNLYLIPLDTSDLSDSDEFPIAGHLIADLISMVVEIGRKAMTGQEDQINDGNQNQ